MRILFDHQSFSRQAQGGVSRSFIELCRALEQGEDTFASILAPLHWNDYLREGVNRSFTYGVHQRRGIFRFWNQRWAINHGLTSAFCRLSPPNVLHETWYSTTPHKLPAKVRLATTVHDLIYQVHPDWTPDSAERSAQLAASLDRADVIFCVSDFTRTDLLHWRPTVDPMRVFVVHHGVTNFPPLTAKEQNFRESPPYFLYVGQRASRNKNFPNLVRAFAASGLQTELALLCFGGGSFSEAERSLFRELQLSEDRILQKSGGDTDLAVAYHHALGLVYPSTYEGFGLPPLEAMAHGCPVTSSNASCLPEIGGDACLYFNPEDIEQMADTLRKICYDSTLREDLIRKGTERARLFTWEKSAHAALAAYQSVL